MMKYLKLQNEGPDTNNQLILNTNEAMNVHGLRTP
jgi:hypothetical protein